MITELVQERKCLVVLLERRERLKLGLNRHLNISSSVQLSNSEAEVFSVRYAPYEENPQEDFDFLELVLANSLSVTGVIKIRVRKASPRTFFGEGQVKKIRQLLEFYGVNTVATNASLSPIHQRNLEDEWKSRILTRSDIIFEIFSKNASTAEGKLQVELATLKYSLSRITGIGKELSSPGGDVGTRGGAGEKLTSLTRDQIRRRIKVLERKIGKATLVRKLKRKRRSKTEIFSVSLVGYTNAGKSSLLNALTKSNVDVDDRYFTTLDPTARIIYLGDGRKGLIKDTVGFLNDLPEELFSAFRATLEELEENDLLLLVADVSRENVDFMIASVLKILQQFGLSDIPIYIVFNKIDLLQDTKYIDLLSEKYPNSIFVSAKSGKGLNFLVELIKNQMQARLTPSVKKVSA